MKKISNIKKGFTLIELLVVIAIIGLLASFLLANFVGVRQRARDGQRKSDLRQIQAALEIYRSDKASYYSSPLPRCGQIWQDDGAVYMQTVPCDPLNPTAPFTYEYRYTPADGTYKLIACLENANDSQKDGTNVARCTGGSRSFTLKNP